VAKQKRCAIESGRWDRTGQCLIGCADAIAEGAGLPATSLKPKLALFVRNRAKALRQALPVATCNISQALSLLHPNQ
jgi:hypothetical protein